MQYYMLLYIDGIDVLNAINARCITIIIMISPKYSIHNPSYT